MKISAWILSILGIVIVGALVDLLLPSGRMNKYVKSVVAAITVLIIVLPLPGLIKNNFKFDGGIMKDDTKLDESFIDYVTRAKLSYLESGLIEALNKEGIRGVTAVIKGDFKDNKINIKSVTINLQNVVIDDDLQHINKYELLEKMVTKFLNVDKGVVIINE